MAFIYERFWIRKRLTKYEQQRFQASYRLTKNWYLNYHKAKKIVIDFRKIINSKIEILQIEFRDLSILKIKNLWYV